MRWCRLYTETPSDPKLRRIAHQAGTTMANVLAVWTSMLCHAAAAEGDSWGTLAGWDDLDVAINLGLDRGIVASIRREMEQRVIFEKRLIRWEARQSSNDISTERVRKWREKKAKENQRPSAAETLETVSETPCNGIRREEKREEGVTTVTPARRAVRAAVSVTTPDWLDADAWGEWCRYRHGRKWTQRAAELSLSALTDLHAAGHDPRIVIEQSIANGWTGLFPIKTRPRPSQQPAGKLDWLIADMQRDQT